MKKIVLIVTSVLLSLLAISSCGLSKKQSNQVEEKVMEAYIKTIDSTTAAIKGAQSSEELQKITSDFATKAKEFAITHAKAEVSKDVLDQITKAVTSYQQATEQKAKEIAKKELE